METNYKIQDERTLELPRGLGKGIFCLEIALISLIAGLGIYLWTTQLKEEKPKPSSQIERKVEREPIPYYPKSMRFY